MDVRKPVAVVEPADAGSIGRPQNQTPATGPSRSVRSERLPWARVGPAAALLGTFSAGVLLYLAPELPRPGPMEAAAVLVLFLSLWITKSVSDHLAAIVFFITAVSIIGVPPEIALSGFHSSAVWLVLGGLIIGAAIKTTGLGNRIATATLTRSSHSYGMVISGAVVVGVVLSFIAPSAVGRVLMLTPIAIAVADRLGFESASRGRNGIILASSLGTLVPSYAVLPSTIPNIAMMGAAQNLYGIEFGYIEYLIANFPILGLGSIVILPVLICGLFGDTPRAAATPPETTAPSQDEKWLIAILAAALVLWASDFLHGISPAWVALGAGMLCLSPGFGPARKISIEQEVNFGVWMLIAAFISLGAVINYCGLGEAVGMWLVAELGLSRGATTWNVAALTAIGSGVSIAASAIGAPTIMTALAQQLATATSWPLEGVMLLQVPTWFFFPLPHQTPVLLIAMSIARVPVWPVVRLLAVFTLIGFAIVLPAQVLWLGMLGYLP